MSPAKRRVDLSLIVIGAGVLIGLGILLFRAVGHRGDHGKDAHVDAGTTESLDGRLVPPEAYMRSYLELFGGLAPLDVQARARGPEGLFDTWDDYVSALGLPDYKLDVPRQTQTNALMVATFERLGVALCDRAADADLGPKAPRADKRVVFAFDAPKGALDESTFAPGFEVLHRTFLGYPTSLAPADRRKRFFDLYSSIFAEHATGAAHSKFTPEQSGWAAVCYGLVRHPEFHLY